MPTIPSIRTSVENKDILVLDNHAKNGIFERDARGRLIAYSGGFSVVFPYKTTNGEKWAFRCWHSDIKNSEKRYETISNAIKNAKLSFLCEFQYIDKGINVEGKIYPTTMMRWIDGITIKDYICQNRNSKDQLITLADNFLKMTQTLHSQSLAHGDLQHGNIIVDNNNQLYLVDYDSFYCPQLRGEADTVTGLADYQHPARINNKYVSEKLDYFSELIIYLGILAIAENPLLVDKYKVNDADQLLFSKKDFVDIRSSDIYKDIQALGKEFQDLLDVLTVYLKCSCIDELQPFETYLLSNRIKFSSSVTKVVRNTQTVVLEWDVPFEAEVSLRNERTDDVSVCENKGTLSTTLSESNVYELLVNRVGVPVIRKQISINAYDECIIEFYADKYYIFPKIPVKLYWNVANANKIWLDSEEVEAKGTKVVESEKAATYILSAEDEFGTKNKRIDIQLLPIPQVKALLVPIPNIIHNMSITIQQPRCNVDVKIPEIEMDWIKTGIPKVPSLTEMGLNVELSPPLPKFNLMSSIRKVFNYLIRK